MRVNVRKITPQDNAAIERIIQQVMPEFGAGGFGFAIHDTEVNNMFEAYQGAGSVYFVCEVNGRVVGGGGIGPLKGGDSKTCELKKMYFLPEARGRGYGQLILKTCIKAATELGYDQCYLETFHTMKDAILLYEKNGFKQMPSSMGNTGHFACDNFFVLSLKS